jgi:bacteriorhodopsin
MAGGNQAIDVNPATGVGIALTTHGSDWLWAVFSIFGLTALVQAGYTFYHFHKSYDKFRAYTHVGPLIVATTLAYTYFTMASNLGWTGVEVEFHHEQPDQDVRQVFYARYIGWFLAWPALLYAFELNAQAQNVVSSSDLLHIVNHLIVQVCSTEVFVLGLLIGALIPSSYKWGYWTFAVSAQLFALTLLIYRQLFSPKKASSLLNSIVMGFYSIVFLLYPVSWGLSEGGNVITPTSEAVFYGVLDLINFWIIPVVACYDSAKNGTYVEGAPKNNADVEKGMESPALRASGETEVPVVEA